MITYDKKNEFMCRIYRLDGAIKRFGDRNSVSASKYFTPIRSLYRKFMHLHSEISEYKRQKTNSSYLSSLCGVFPGTLDEHLLGGTDGEEEKE